MSASKKNSTESQKMPRISAIDQDILIVLRHGRSLYGLEILDSLNLEERPKKLRFSSLYPALDRLVDRGLLTWDWGSDDDKSGGARRKYYKITSDGLTALQALEAYRFRLNQQAEST